MKRNIFGYMMLAGIVAAVVTAAVISFTDKPHSEMCEFYPEPFKWGVSASAEVYSNKGRFSLNENRVLVHDYASSYENLGKWENPFFISRYANALYRDWIDSGCSNDKIYSDFITQAEYLRSSAEVNDSEALWRYPFDNSYYHVKAGWFSGIGQSHIAIVLYRAGIVENNSELIELAEKAMSVYKITMNRGGVVTKEDENIWIQEVPSPDGKSFRILNGHITGMFGVIDYMEISGDDSFNEIIDGARNAVLTNLPNFDAGFSSFYSLQESTRDSVRIAPINGYHALHAWQLKRMGEYFGNEAFYEYSTKFSRYISENDEILRSASNSTNPEDFSPSEAAGWFANRYWSSNIFPTWFELTFNEDRILKGVAVISHTEDSSPRDFSMSIARDNVYEEVINVEGSNRKYFFIELDKPVRVDKVRITINSDNGNNNVALAGVMPVFCDVNRERMCATDAEEVVGASVSPIVPGYLYD